MPLIARQIVDRVIIAHTSALWPWLLLLLAVAVATFGFAYVRRYRGGRVALEVQYDLRNAMHDHLQDMDLDTSTQLPTGQLVARANSDSALVQGAAQLPADHERQRPADGRCRSASCSCLSPLLAIVSLIVAARRCSSVSYRMRRRVFPATWDGQQREGDVAQIVDEDVNGVRVVKAFGQEQRELERIVGAAKTLYGSRMRAVRLQSRYQPLLEAIPSLGQVAILAARRLAGAAPPHHASAPSSPSPPTSASSPHPPASWPASSPSASRPGPASSGSSSCSTSRRPSPTRPTPSSCRRCGARSTFERRPLRLRRRPAGAAGLRPAHRGGRTGRAGRRQRQRQIDRRRAACRASTTRTRARSRSTATTCAT